MNRCDLQQDITIAVMPNNSRSNRLAPIIADRLHADIRFLIYTLCTYIVTKLPLFYLRQSTIKSY